MAARAGADIPEQIPNTRGAVATDAAANKVARVDDGYGKRHRRIHG